MSSENITQALTNLRTAIDTKIDETLAGPKTVDQMITAVNTITIGSGETEETPKLCLMYLPCEKLLADTDVLKQNEFVFGSMRYARVLPVVTDTWSYGMTWTGHEYMDWAEIKSPLNGGNYVFNIKGQPEDESYESGLIKILQIPLGAKLLLNDFTIDFFIRKNFTYSSEMTILSFERDFTSYNLNLSYIGPNKIKLSLVNDSGATVSSEGEIDTSIFNDDIFIYLRLERFGNKFSVSTTAKPITSYDTPPYSIQETEIVKFIELECPLTTVKESATSKAYFGDFTRICNWYLNKVRIFNYSITNYPGDKNSVDEVTYFNIIEETR
jgi:hypothetical protein